MDERAHPLQSPILAYAAAGDPSVKALGRVLIQVTEDNERFAVVDVSGLSDAAAIKERMLSKLRESPARTAPCAEADTAQTSSTMITLALRCTAPRSASSTSTGRVCPTTSC